MTYMVLKNFAFGLLILLIFSESLIAESGGNSSIRARTWFEWGEYGRILDSVPSFLEEVPDSLKKAELNKYLAVARFAAGNIGPAREAFIQALELNRDIELDEDFVSNEMLDLFVSTREEYLMSMREQALQDSILRERQRELLRRDIVLDSIARTEKRTRRRQSITATIAGGALAALFLAGAVYEYRLAEDAYTDYSEARIIGDKVGYDAAKEKTEYHDRLYLGSAALSVLSATVTTVFAIAAHRARIEEDSPESRLSNMRSMGKIDSAKISETESADATSDSGEGK